MAKLKVAMIGLGMAAGHHARALLDLAEQVECAAAYSPTAARREAFAAQYPIPVIDSVDAIFDDPDIDAVLILTPPSSHWNLSSVPQLQENIFSWKSHWISAFNGPRLLWLRLRRRM